MQAAALVKIGVLQWKSPKAFFGGACGQDWIWQSDQVLHEKCTQWLRLLQAPGSDIEKVSRLVQAVSGSEGLQLIRVTGGF